MRRSGAIFSNPVGGGGGVGLITRITLKYLKFGLKIVNAFDMIVTPHVYYLVLIYKPVLFDLISNTTLSIDGA